MNGTPTPISAKPHRTRQIVTRTTTQTTTTSNLLAMATAPDACGCCTRATSSSKHCHRHDHFVVCLADGSMRPTENGASDVDAGVDVLVDASMLAELVEENLSHILLLDCNST